MPYNVKPIESLTASPWYEVVDTDNQFHLWIVEHNPTTDNLACSCDAAWCPHRAAVTQEVVAADYQAEQADAIARQHGQY
jgi:hypothetical protein